MPYGYAHAKGLSTLNTPKWFLPDVSFHIILKRGDIPEAFPKVITFRGLHSDVYSPMIRLALMLKISEEILYSLGFSPE